MSIHHAARSFDAAAGDYERARPGYPAEAGRWLTERLELRPGRTVLDLAAGTGKLTRLLAETGARVVAVEPVAGMRARLAEALSARLAEAQPTRLSEAQPTRRAEAQPTRCAEAQPTRCAEAQPTRRAEAQPALELLDGTAEAIPVGDASVDAVTVAQAFHWFDGERALAEIHRVTRAHGRLAVVYNRRPLDDPLQAALGEILAPHRADTPAHATRAWREAFAHTSRWAPVEETELPHVQHLDREGVVARVGSISFVAALPEQRRTEVLAEVRSLVATRPQPVSLPYICELFVWGRVS